MTKWSSAPDVGRADVDSLEFYVEISDKPGYEGVNHCAQLERKEKIK